MQNVDSDKWWSLEIEEVLSRLQSDKKKGLSEAEVGRRQVKFGRNVLASVSRRSLFFIFLDQFKDFMIWVLIGAGVIAGFIGAVEDLLAIFAIVVLNAILGFVQEFRSERALEALKKMTDVKAQVVRSGIRKSCLGEELVPGDIVFLESGDKVPAEIRVISSENWSVDESTLTGESHSVEKNNLMISPDVQVGTFQNILYKGTIVTIGRGFGVVVATGMKTEVGRIAALLENTSEDTQTPLQKRLAQFGKRLALVILGLCAGIFFIGILRGIEPWLMLLTALSLAVAAIPEALPAVVTVLLSLGARRMMKSQALIRRLPAVETLGSVTTICTDKTGTLTQNRMQLEAYFFDHQVFWCSESQKFQISKGSGADNIKAAALSELFLRAMALNNNVVPHSEDVLQGEPTEKALYEAALRWGYDKSEIEKELPRIQEVAFSSDRGFMATLHQDANGLQTVFIKGAPEKVIKDCEPQELNLEYLSQAEALAQEGLRVLAFAYKTLKTKGEDLEGHWTFLGLVGLADPPRPEVAAAIENCRKASIKVVMMTGDHPVTAQAIARQVGLEGPLLAGSELKSLSSEAFYKKVQQVRIYARVSPEQKIQIVKALQEQGEVVAMTGDGVNDAPALKRADIGVAMGQVGTDVAREASHMVLLDDNFATIVQSVREGRRIYDNIRKFVKYALATNAGELATLFIAPLIGLPMPFLPIHILWINLLTDGLPGVALTAEKEERDLMQRPPRDPQESLFAEGLWQHVLGVGALMAIVNLSLMAWELRSGSNHWQSMVFMVMTLSQMGHVLAIRSEKESLFRQGLFSNLPLLGAVFLTLILQMATLYLPFMNQIFKTQPLNFSELMLCLGLSLILFIAVEIEKWFRRRK